jgi:ketosteroid isomerase-like protein
VKAANAGDRAAARSIWAPGVVGWFPSAPVFSDSAANAVAGVAGVPGARSTYAVTVDDVAVSGDLAAVHDIWRETRHYAGSAVVVNRVIRGSELWRRQPDGSWRIARWVSAPEPWERSTPGDTTGRR